METPPVTQEENRQDGLYRTLAKIVWLSLGVFVLAWFLDAAMTAVLLFLFALILALSLNPPVTWMEQRRVPRWAGTLLVSVAIAAVAGLLGWLIVPQIAEQASSVAENLPGYADQLQERLARRLSAYPEVERRLRDANGSVAEQVVPALQTVASRIGRYTMTALGLIVFTIVLISAVIYALIQPRPLLKGYLEAFPPPLRDPAAKAFSRGSQSVVGWLWSNVIIGGIEGVGAAVFLSFIGVPGALVWGALTFFAELIPKIGPYLMAAPPLLVALAVDPMDAVWVLLFYIAIQTIAGDVVGPLVRANQMDVHPVSVLFATVALAAAFGLLGALIATPLVGFVKAFYDEFYRARQPHDDRLDARVEVMLTREGEKEKKEKDEEAESSDSAADDAPQKDERLYGGGAGGSS